MSKVLTCYAEGRAGQWEAVCLDFDLAVQGRSFQEVSASLDTAIDDYLEYVKGLPEKERGRFLRRRVPFFTRLRFACLVLASAMLLRLRSDDRQRYEFTRLCPA